MSLCSSGITQKQASAPANIVILAEFFESILPAGLVWLKPFLPYIKPIVISSVDDFCSIDPPGNPSLVGLTFGAVLAGGEFGAGLVAVEAVSQFLYNYLWYRLCECASVSTPAAPAAPIAPADLPIVNPPSIVQPPTTSPCLSIDSGVAGPPPTGTGFATPFADVLLPTGATLVQLNIQDIVLGTRHSNYNWNLQYRTTIGGSFTSLATGTIASGKVTTPTAVAIPAGVVYLTITASSAGAPTNVDDKIRVRADVTCGMVVAQPCCPADDATLALMRQILDLVTVTQRQAAPFSYVYGANHTGLTGAGFLTVADLIGVSVDVTTLPSYLGVEVGAPDELFDVGYITLGTTDGYISSRRIDHDGTLILPAAAGVFTSIGYALAPGVVVAVRELVREP